MQQIAQKDSKEKVFLFLDDDAFRVENGHPVRHPRYYYPILGTIEADKVLEAAYAPGVRIEKFTTVEGTMDFIERNGCPWFISFDNDLMRDLEGVHLAHWLVEKDMDQGGGFIPSDFHFFVHSQNKIAMPRIQSYLSQYLQQR